MKKVIIMILLYSMFMVSCSRNDHDLRIVFARFSSMSVANLYIMSSDGSHVKQLTEGNWIDSYCSWSPDCKKIAFSSNRDGNFKIYVINEDGTNLERLTDTLPGYNDYMPTWSPDGKNILFYSNISGNLEIYIMKADGTGTPTNLSNNSSADSLPSMSPDGSQIVFQTNRDGNMEIYIMNADGTGTPTNLTNTAANDTAPTWSPDGSKILYESFSGTYDLWTINPDSPATSKVNITNTTTIGEAKGSWSPDGSEIIFAQGSTPKNIGKINADGTENITLLPCPAYDLDYACFEGKPK
ncbi:MAG TPA: DPP IV N-terminal domain-containing protein [Spirochaetota bacterium]|nr:DPP IV N-terminal domain-containing protein [Spirochaetota bacterium]